MRFWVCFLLSSCSSCNFQARRACVCESKLGRHQQQLDKSVPTPSTLASCSPPPHHLSSGSSSFHHLHYGCSCRSWCLPQGRQPSVRSHCPPSTTTTSTFASALDKARTFWFKQSNLQQDSRHVMHFSPQLAAPSLGLMALGWKCNHRMT